MCGKLCRCCKTCKHCEEYETVDYEYLLCSEPAFRCKAKNRDIWFVGMPRPFCKSFEPKPSYEEVYKKACRTAIDELTDVYHKLGGNAESVSKVLQSMATSSYETARFARMETEYKNVNILRTIESHFESCPVCGGKPRVQVTNYYRFDIGEQTRYDVRCRYRCGQIFSSLNLGSLMESWNRYASESVINTDTKTKPNTTNCPNCGAPVDIHAEKCAYCDTPYI